MYIQCVNVYCLIMLPHSYITTLLLAVKSNSEQFNVKRKQVIMIIMYNVYNIYTVSQQLTCTSRNNPLNESPCYADGQGALYVVPPVTLYLYCSAGGRGQCGSVR